jgi:hypothetical protein
MSENTYKTHDLFFEVLSKNKLNELLNRISSGYLTNQINNNLQNYIVKCEIKDNICDTYIHFYEINTGKQIGHISFHLDKLNKQLNYYSLQKGRFHVVNNRNRNRYYTLKINRTNDNSIIMYVKSNLTMKDNLSECTTVTLNILNDYFNPNSNLYLQYRLTKYGNKNHICIDKIYERVNKKGKSYLSNTRSKSKSTSKSMSYTIKNKSI